jgi:hypothetical protein
MPGFNVNFSPETGRFSAFISCDPAEKRAFNSKTEKK